MSVSFSDMRMYLHGWMSQWSTLHVKNEWASAKKCEQRITFYHELFTWQESTALRIVQPSKESRRGTAFTNKSDVTECSRRMGATGVKRGRALSPLHPVDAASRNAGFLTKNRLMFHVIPVLSLVTASPGGSVIAVTHNGRSKWMGKKTTSKNEKPTNIN